MSMKQIVTLIVLMFALMPFISADLITPGFHTIPVVNNITNFNDFSDYYFLTICKNPMPEVSLIERGVIGSCYKFSDLSVYMAKKSEFDINDIDSINKLEETEFVVFFNQSKFKEVLSDVQHYETVSVASATREVYHEYVIDINKLKSNPDNTIIERNNLIYYYLITPLIVLIIIIWIVLLRKRKNASA